MIANKSIALGHILLGHFEERTPRFKKLLKFVFVLIFVVFLSITFGSTVALTIFGLLFIPVIYIHLYLLPKKGINGWTGEPKSRYYEYRKWEKNIFKNRE
ncbi:hypothetical protein BH23BAC1_BH23BAC1_35960 [soil metagenome]